MDFTTLFCVILGIAGMLGFAALRLPEIRGYWALRGKTLRRGRRGVGWVTTHAKVADVSTLDVGEGNEAQTMYRFVLLFTQENGEAVAVDRTCRLSSREKDALVPDAVVTIQYDPRDPERFEITALPQPGVTQQALSDGRPPAPPPIYGRRD